MKLRLEAEPEELAARGDHLVRQLAKALGPHAPELAGRLEKALEREPQARAHQLLAIQDGVEDIRGLYQRCLQDIQEEAGKELDAQVDLEFPK